MGKSLEGIGSKKMEISYNAIGNWNNNIGTYLQREGFIFLSTSCKRIFSYNLVNIETSTKRGFNWDTKIGCNTSKYCYSPFRANSRSEINYKSFFWETRGRGTDARRRRKNRSHKPRWGNLIDFNKILANRIIHKRVLIQEIHKLKNSSVES